MKIEEISNARKTTIEELCAGDVFYDEELECYYILPEQEDGIAITGNLKAVDLHNGDIDTFRKDNEILVVDAVMRVNA